MAKFKAGDIVYWIEPPSSVRSGEVIRIAGTWYVIRRGYNRLPESRLYPSYEAAAATLPKKLETEKRTGHWHWWAG